MSKVFQGAEIIYASCGIRTWISNYTQWSVIIHPYDIPSMAVYMDILSVEVVSWLINYTPNKTTGMINCYVIIFVKPY